MFMMFAMTTDSVGIIIPEIIKTFHLNLTAAGSFQYATMGGIGVAGFLLGHLADRFGRKRDPLRRCVLFIRRWQFILVFLRAHGSVGLPG